MHLQMRAPNQLSKRAIEVLKQMEENEHDDDGEIACEGLSCWIGNEQTNLHVVRQLLECVFISEEDEGEGKLKRYTINSSGKLWLQGKKPYRDGDGNEYDTFEELWQCQQKKRDIIRKNISHCRRPQCQHCGSQNAQREKDHGEHPSDGWFCGDCGKEISC